MADFGIFRGFGDKLFQGQLPMQLGMIGNQIYGATPLLDTYPGAYNAYSLRLLRTAYTGSCIRVRRSSDNAEQDIGLTTSGVLDTAALLAFCAASSGFVTTWYDQSGNGRNATQTTASKQPKIVNIGTVMLSNGKPTLNFTQADQQSISFTGTANTKSVFSVLEYTSNPNNDFIFWLGGTDYHGDPTTWLAIYASTSVKNGNNRLNGTTTDLVTTSKTTGIKIISMVHQTTASLSSIGLGNLTTRCWQGNFSELVFYTSDQTSNIGGLEGNMNSMYNVY